MNVTEILLNNKLCQLVRKTGDGKMTNITMKSGEGRTLESKFKYFRLQILESSGNNTIQFSGLGFYSNSGRRFSIVDELGDERELLPKYIQCEVTQTEGGKWGVNEEGIYGLLSIPKNGKACYIGYGFPLTFTYTLLQKTIDVKQFNKWKWYTSNDTYENPGRNITKFKLQFTNNKYDENSWVELDYNDDPKNIKTIGTYDDQWQVAYEHNLDLSKLKYL